MSKAAVITKKLGASVVANTTCPQWLAFLNRIFDEDRELIAFIQRAVGYTLTGSCEEQCLFILIGSGANGKSTFLNTLQALLGDYAASVPMQSLMEQKYGSQQTNDIAHLLGQRLVTASEGERGQKLAESKIKQMTGGDLLSCRHLYRDLFEYRPQFKLWLATNTLPTIVGTDEAIWRRIRLIPFSVTIPPDEQDKTLATRLAAELAGILNWAVEGWKFWKDGGLNPPDQVVQSTGTYRTENDSVGQWIDAACVIEPGLRTSMKRLHESYHSWCENSGFEPLTSSCLSKELGRRGFDQMRTSTGNGRRGIGIKQPIESTSYPWPGRINVASEGP
jgi:putative DNA primase/helicase